MGEQEAIRRLFGRLITLGEGSEDTRRRVRMSELVTGRVAAAAIDTYGVARLFTFDRDPATREPTVEVAHEAIIGEWPRLRDWLDDDRQGLRSHRQSDVERAAWHERARDDGDLYRGVRLEVAEAWAQWRRSTMNTQESAFLHASLERRDAEELVERNRIRRLRRLLVTTALVAIVALIAGTVAIR